jgi:hypothetical protein
MRLTVTDEHPQTSNKLSQIDQLRNREAMAGS